MPGKIDNVGNQLKKAVSIETDRVLKVKVGSTEKRVLVAHLSNGECLDAEREMFLKNFGYSENKEVLPYQNADHIDDHVMAVKELLDGKHTHAQKEKFHVRRLDMKLT